MLHEECAVCAMGGKSDYILLTSAINHGALKLPLIEPHLIKAHFLVNARKIQNNV